MIPFYSRWLSTAQYGVISLVELTTTIVAIGFGLEAIGQAMVRIANDQPDEAGRRRVIATALIGTLVLASVTVVLMWLAAAPIARAFNIPTYANLLRAAFMAMFFATIAEIVLVQERMHGGARFFLLYSLITMAATVVLNIVFIGYMGFGVWGFVSSKLAVIGCAGIFLYGRAMWRYAGIGFDPAIARKLAFFAGPLVISGLSNLSVHYSDRAFLAQVSTSQVGVYSLAYNFALLLSILIGDSFSKSWDVSVFGFARREGWQDHFAAIGKWFVLILAAGAMGIALFGTDVLQLLVPASYVPPLLLIPVLILAYFFREIGDFMRSILLVGIGSGLVGRITLFAALLNLGLNALLIPRFGIWGAAIATLLTWAIYCGICFVAAARIHKMFFRLRPLFWALGLSVAAMGFYTHWAPPGAIDRLARDAELYVVFLMALIGFAYDGGERAMIWKFIRNLRRERLLF